VAQREGHRTTALRRASLTDRRHAPSGYTWTTPTACSPPSVLSQRTPRRRPSLVLLVGPPGGGKSEILNSLSGLPFTRTAGTLTEASLLSGTPKKDSGNARGGLLREIGDFGVIVAKDFGSILSMNRDANHRRLPRSVRSTTDHGPGSSGPTAAARSSGKAKSGSSAASPHHRPPPRRHGRNG